MKREKNFLTTGEIATHCQVSLVALEIFLKGSQEPMRLVGEGRWLREGRGGQGHEAGLEFIAIKPQDRERWVEEVYASL